MKLKRTLIVSVLLAVLCLLTYSCLPGSPGFIRFYSQYIYTPLQSLRGWSFGWLPFSIGDLIYIGAGACLLFTLGRWVHYLINFRKNKRHLGLSALKLVNTILFVYLFFVAGWGTNYYKPELRSYWGLETKDTISSVEERKAKAKADLIAFDQFLVEKLNTYAPHYHSLTLKEINKRSVSYYGQYTDSKLVRYGLSVKPTFFSYFLMRLAVEGYYNPFTGEGQVNAGLPSFMMPFLVCHEQAHQAGIAAEGDANLAAYAVCTMAEDSSFRYSGYLDIWLYTNNSLYRRDSASALEFEAQLNSLTKAHIDTMEELSEAYQNEYARYSTELFDTYLKMQDQKEGIRSYSNVAVSAWQLELRRAAGDRRLIRIRKSFK